MATSARPNPGKWVWTTDQNGDRKRIERPARLKPWWVKDGSGNVILFVKYGSKPIELPKGKPAVDVGAAEKLPAVLKTVAAGELDTGITLVAKERAAALGCRMLVTLASLTACILEPMTGRTCHTPSNGAKNAEVHGIIWKLQFPLSVLPSHTGNQAHGLEDKNTLPVIN